MSAGAGIDESVDPRVERSLRVIRQAALAEFAEAGYGGFTMESVAQRAKVGKSTVYRHWDGKVALIADALETLNQQPAPDIGEGSPRERVERVLQHLVTVLADSTFGRCVAAQVEAAERDPTMRDFHHRYSARRRRTLVKLIKEGVASGDFRAGLDPELAALALAGAIFYRRTMTGTPFQSARLPELIDTVLGART